MKLLPSSGAAAGEGRPGGQGSVAGERTVVVGVKLDQQSRELLTWALVKVAEPGDQVIALHVLGYNGTVCPWINLLFLLQGRGLTADFARPCRNLISLFSAGFLFHVLRICFQHSAIKREAPSGI